MEIRFAILFLVLGTVLVSSHKHSKHEISNDAHSESMMKPHYSRVHKAPHTYILEEDDYYPMPHGNHGGGKNEEYIDSEKVSSHKEQEQAQGNESSDKNVKDDEYDDHAEKRGHQGFQAGGTSFDKHLKDHKADNKEIENIKQHDAGEKFGGESTKAHKLGKHKDKSKGHKLHGFKNVYHKEEYGDHKTFHDEFLDSDHQHNYDDQHEHKEMRGGKFSKGYKHEGKNKKYDKGDEKREWGKEEFDRHREGKNEKGGQSSRHRHGSKKHQGQYDANSQRNKNSVHKVKKGTPPPHFHHPGHHGPHQAQIQPYVSHYNMQHHQAHVPSHHHNPHAYQKMHEVQYDDDHQDKHKNHGSHHHNSHDDQHNSYGGNSHHAHNGYHDDDDDDDHDHHIEYSHDNNGDDHESAYQERNARNHHHRRPVKERLADKNNERIIQKYEPITNKQFVTPHHEIQQYRQPVYQEQPRYKQPQYTHQEKFSQPFDDKFQHHRIRYGYQSPRNHHPHHTHSHHHLQSFPRFPGFTHHHKPHERHHHHDHNKHFRPVPSFEQQSKSDTIAHKVEYVAEPNQNENTHHGLLRKQHE